MMGYFMMNKRAIFIVKIKFIWQYLNNFYFLMIKKICLQKLIFEPSQAKI